MFDHLALGAQGHQQYSQLLRQQFPASEARLGLGAIGLAQKLRVLLMPLSTQSEMVEQLREYLNPQKPGKGR